jgi:hypothetical protein
MTVENTRPASVPDGFDDVVHVWDRHDDEEYRRDQSHWRGVGRWDDETWKRMGTTLVARLRELHRVVRRPFPPPESMVVLEWGPGGGANLHALAPFASTMYGVDVSAKNLDECARQLAEVDADGRFRPVLLEGPPGDVAAAIDEPVELFVSAAVFQNFPSREYGHHVLATMFGAMAPAALGYIQIRYDDGNPKYAPKDVAEYRQRHITANSYPLVTFWKMLAETGFRPLQITNLNTGVNYATFTFLKPA